MNSLQIKCFLEAARCGSFSKAASKLFITQPTFSRNISQLERELGVTLFCRNSFHGIVLTEAGEVLAETFSDAAKTIEAGIDKARKAEEQADIPLTFGLLTGQLVDEKLNLLITEFRLLHPNINISITRDTYKGLIYSLHSKETDLVYMPEWQFVDTSELVCRPIGKMETVLVIPKRLIPHLEDREYSLKEFEEYPFITVEETESSHATNMLRDLCSALQMTPHIREYHSIRKQIEKVEMGEGMILINPNNSVCFSPNVHRVKIKELLPQSFAVAWERRNTSPAVSLFDQFLQRAHNN